MRLCYELKKEISEKGDGNFRNTYFRAMGYTLHATSNTVARANAVRALFTRPVPHIYRNDIIVGSLRPVCVSITKEELEKADDITRNYPERGFIHNSDHFAPDHETILKLGIGGLLAKIDASAKKHAADTKKTEYLRAMRIALTAMRDMIAAYAEKAQELRGCGGYDDERLGFIENNCESILDAPPETFAQALQLVWFIHTCFLYEGRYAMALGRMDQYLYPFYRRDIDNGVITPGDAVQMLENVFMKIYEYRVLRYNDDVVNICIGGSAPDGKTCVNELSYHILHAVRNCNIPGPNLSARISSSTPDEFLDECLKVIGTGLGYPALMNDEVNIKALRRYGYAEQDVYDYCMVGCIENFISGKQPPWSDGRFDTPRFFEYLFNNGKGIMSDESQGVDTGNIEDVTSMSEFMNRFEEQLKDGVRKYMEWFYERNCRFSDKENYSTPFLSLFCRDCIDRGLDINDGGSLYPSAHGVCLMGIGTTADALAAIEKTVFVDHTLTLAEIKKAVICNFEGCEDVRRLLLDAPKYGNNDDFVDKYAVWFVDFLHSRFSIYHTPDGGGIYVAMAANTSNIYAGHSISATPDGRKAGQPLSDAASPTFGRDTHGATFTINSVSKPDYCKVSCGTVINQKFSPSMFNDEKRPKLAALIRVYFAGGGQEIQINATSREVLKAAMREPENYQDLVVRVSGFSAYFVTLDSAVQNDILNRTQQG